MKKFLALLFAAMVFLPTLASAASCPMITVRLSNGSSHTQVIALKKFLVAEGVMGPNEYTKYFGPLTQAALQKWQCQKGIVCKGTPASTGYGATGPVTRTALRNCNSFSATSSDRVQSVIQSQATPVRNSNISVPSSTPVVTATTTMLQQSVTICSAEAKQCPDGSYVSRSGPSCEFATCNDNVDKSLTSGNYKLSFPGNISGHGLQITAVNGVSAVVSVDAPASILTCDTCLDQGATQDALSVRYENVTASDDGSLVATAKVNSANQSQFLVTDTFKKGNSGGFEVERRVRVDKVGAGDRGFNSQFVIGFKQPIMIDNLHFFAPGIWYDKNSSVALGAIASNFANNYFYWRETRSGLPFVMMQNPDGTTLSLAHVQAAPSSGVDEAISTWVVDGSIQYGSLGVQKKPQMSIGYMYPADEGEGNYVNNLSWSRRSHPVIVGFTQTYTLSIDVDKFQTNSGIADFAGAVSQTWRMFYERWNPPVRSVQPLTVYNDGIQLLKNYSTAYGTVQGVPFRTWLPTGEMRSLEEQSFMMGYVGQQIPIGFQLLRYGVLNNDAAALAKGKSTLNFWTEKARQPSGLPKTWYDVSVASFRDNSCAFPVFTRVVSDGMEGALDAAVFARTHAMAQVEWESFVTAYGDWLVAHQNSDGSFYRAYNPDGSVFANAVCSPNALGTSKSDTTHVVRFLVGLYFASGDAKYLNAARMAGNYAYNTISLSQNYIGGTIDNPNVIDREGGVMALHAFLALYDATQDPKWLQAAKSAANYVETWMYAWNFAIKNAPAAYSFAGTQGSSLIATGHSGADIFLSSETFDYYRLYLLLSDPHYLSIARNLESNTKLTTQVTGNSAQNFGYSKNGLVGEATNFSLMKYAGSDSERVWLPWLTIAEIEPVQKIYDMFGAAAISEVEQLPYTTRLERNSHPYFPPGTIGWGAMSVKLLVNGSETATISAGQSVTYSWIITGAASCTLDWVGPKSGSHPHPTASGNWDAMYYPDDVGTYKVTVTCSNGGTNTMSSSVNLIVLPVSI